MASQKQEIIDYVLEIKLPRSWTITYIELHKSTGALGVEESTFLDLGDECERDHMTVS